jgi:chromosome segregation ATPase
MSSNDTRIEFLRRLASYGPPGLDQDQRRQLLDCADGLHGTDAGLTAALPSLSTLADLLKVLVDPKKFQDAVSKLDAQVKAAAATRDEARQAAEDLESKKVTLEPKLKAAQAAHDRLLAAERQAFEKQVEATQHSLAIRTAAVATLEERVRADADAVAKNKADLERRLEIMRGAAA